MRTKKLLFTAGAAAATATFVTLLNAPGQPARAQSAYPPRTGSASEGTEAGGMLEVRVGTDRTQYPGNRPVQMTLYIANTRYDKISISSGSKPEYDFVVRNARTGKAVWSLWKNRPGLAAPRGFTLRQGETRNHSQLWDQTDDSGARVPAGVYTIEAVLWSGRTISTQVYLGGNAPGRPGRPGNGGNGGNGPGRPGNDGNGNSGGGVVQDGNRLALASTLTADRAQLMPGGTLRLTYTVTNPTRVTQTARFSSGKQFDMSATGPRGQVVWQQSQGMFYTQAMGGLSLAPGQARTYNAEWRIPADLPPGNYTVSAYLATQPFGSQGGAAPAMLRLPLGRSSGNNGGGNGNNNNGGGNYPLLSLREMASVLPHRLVGQKVTVSGSYLGLKGGPGAPPVSRADWVLAGDGVTVYVTGPLPETRPGRTVTVSGILRRSGDGRHYIDSRSR